MTWCMIIAGASNETKFTHQGLMRPDMSAAEQLHPLNWNTSTQGSPYTGKPQAIRWVTRLRYQDPKFGKWHATDGSCLYTACGSVIVLLAADGAVERGDLKQVNCRNCLSKLTKLNLIGSPRGSR